MKPDPTEPDLTQPPLPTELLDITDADIEACIAQSTPAMQELLEAQMQGAE